MHWCTAVRPSTAPPAGSGHDDALSAPKTALFVNGMSRHAEEQVCVCVIVIPLASSAHRSFPSCNADPFRHQLSSAQIQKRIRLAKTLSRRRHDTHYPVARPRSQSSKCLSFLRTAWSCLVVDNKCSLCRLRSEKRSHHVRLPLPPPPLVDATAASPCSV